MNAPTAPRYTRGSALPASHAAAVVFGSGVPLTMVPLDCTHQALTSPARIAVIHALGGRMGPAVAGWLAFAVRFDEQKYGQQGGAQHGPCTTPA